MLNSHLTFSCFELLTTATRCAYVHLAAASRSSMKRAADGFTACACRFRSPRPWGFALCAPCPSLRFPWASGRIFGRVRARAIIFLRRARALKITPSPLTLVTESNRPPQQTFPPLFLRTPLLLRRLQRPSLGNPPASKLFFFKGTLTRNYTPIKMFIKGE